MAERQATSNPAVAAAGVGFRRMAEAIARVSKLAAMTPADTETIRARMKAMSRG